MRANLSSCLQDILGARFHCAICDSIDICSNCESAGLPGNLDSSDGGHISSHILIKACTLRRERLIGLTSKQIPYPLETHEVQTASRRAIHLWTGRDAAHVLTESRSKPSSVYSSYAQTVVGSRMQLIARDDPPEDHRVICNGCNEVCCPRYPRLRLRRFVDLYTNRPSLGRDTNVQHAHRRQAHTVWSA